MTPRVKKLSYLLAISLVAFAATLSLQETTYQNAYNQSAAVFMHTAAQNAAAHTTRAPQTVTPTVRPGQTVRLNAGWNLIGTAGRPVAVAAISGCRFGSPAYSYDGTQYNEVKYLKLGRGYWIYANSACAARFPGNDGAILPPQPQIRQGEGDNSSADNEYESNNAEDTNMNTSDNETDAYQSTTDTNATTSDTANQ